jgi:iron(III) transport system permease protein
MLSIRLTAKVFASRPNRRRWFPGLPPVTVALALIVCAGMLVPLGYLVMRTVDARESVLPLVFRARTADILWNTVRLAVGVTAGSCLIAVPLAWLTTRTDLYGRRFWNVVLPLPLVIPSYAGAVAMIGLLGPRGFAQQWLQGAGIPALPNLYGYTGAWLVLTLFTYPYVYLQVRAAFRGLDPSLEEASATLGLGMLATFWRCVLPQLRPSIGSGLLLVSLYTISDFGVVTMLRYETFTRTIYTQYRAAFDRSLAAALGLLLVMLAMAVLVAEFRMQRRTSMHRTGVGAMRSPRMVTLGRWQWIAVGWCVSVMIAALGAPIGMFCYWAVRGTSTGQRLDRLPAAVAGSLSIGILTAIGVVIAAWPVATLAARHSGRLPVFLERLSYLGFALPGIVTALAFVFLGARFLPALYQTLPFLVMAMVVRFLPHGVGSVKASLLQIDPRLEQASHVLGASVSRTVSRITVPLAWPGVVSGATLVLLGAMKELPIVLLLAPTGYHTLATEIWSASDDGALGRAAIPAILLILISTIPTIGLDRRREEIGLT